MKLRLLRKEPMDGGIVSFVWESPAEFSWQPGQYAKYTLLHENPDDRGTERWFTIAAPPFEGKPRITTRIAAEKGSSFKKALLALEPGDTIEADAPEGDFVLNDLGAEYVFLAGGIGFTPFHAILTQLDRDGRVPKITILYGARDDHPTYREELDKLAAKHPDLKVHYIVEPQRINAAIIKKYVSDLKAPYFYVSGPEPMVDAFDDILQGMGVPEDHIKNDHFPNYTW